MDDLGKINILIIDDEQDIRDYLRKILERSGYQVFTASDGEEGLSKIKEFDIEIVLSDILMPKINGIEFLKEAHNYSLIIQVIMITGRSDLNNALEAVEHGASGYLIKPIKNQELMDSIIIAQRNIKEKRAMIQKAINQLNPTQVDDYLMRVLKVGKDTTKKKNAIKNTSDQ